jgi:hypothetical protein
MIYISSIHHKEGIMVRTQIYLTEEEQGKIRGISAKMGKPQSHIIREAIDQYIIKYVPSARKMILSKAKGLWKDRKGKIDLDTMRREYNRV